MVFSAVLGVGNGVDFWTLAAAFQSARNAKRQKKVSPKMTRLHGKNRQNLWINTVHRLVKQPFHPLKIDFFKSVKDLMSKRQAFSSFTKDDNCHFADTLF